AEELGAAGPAAVDALAVLVEELAGSRALRAGLAQHVVLLGGELGAPLRVGLRHLLGLRLVGGVGGDGVMCSHASMVRLRRPGVTSRVRRHTGSARRPPALAVVGPVRVDDAGAGALG